jgi:hypothetical protein
MRKTLLVGAIAALGLGLLPSASVASEAEAAIPAPVVAAVVLPVVVPVAPGISLLVSGEAVGGPGPARTFAGSCQGVVSPPLPDYSVAVFCDVNTTRLADPPLGLFTPIVSVAVSQVTATVTAPSYRFCIHSRVVGPGLVAFPPSQCVSFL